MFLFSSKWWILGLGEQREQWALIGQEGRVATYDPSGKIISRSKYNSNFRAATILKRRGFRKLRRRDLARVQPPEIDKERVR